jgi:hypothetical protein
MPGQLADKRDWDSLHFVYCLTNASLKCLCNHSLPQKMGWKNCSEQKCVESEATVLSCIFRPIRQWRVMESDLSQCLMSVIVPYCGWFQSAPSMLFYHRSNLLLDSNVSYSTQLCSVCLSALWLRCQPSHWSVFHLISKSALAILFFPPVPWQECFR